MCVSLVCFCIDVCVCSVFLCGCVCVEIVRVNQEEVFVCTYVCVYVCVYEAGGGVCL